MEKQTKTTERKGIGLNTLFMGFTIVGAVLFLLVLLIYTFGIVGTSLEFTAISNTVTNQSDNTGNVVYANATGYQLADGVTGNPRTFAITAVWNVDSGVYNVSVPLTNVTVSDTGVLTNNTVTTYTNLSVSYTYNNDSAEITASKDSQTNTSRAIPLVGILFIVLALGALIFLLVRSLRVRRRS